MTTLYQDPNSDSARISHLEAELERFNEELETVRQENQKYISENLRQKNHIQDLEKANELLRQTIASDPNQKAINDKIEKLTLNLKQAEQENASLRKEVDLLRKSSPKAIPSRDKYVAELQEKLQRSEESAESMKKDYIESERNHQAEKSKLEKKLKESLAKINQLEKSASDKGNSNKKSSQAESRQVKRANELNNKQKETIEKMKKEKKTLEAKVTDSTEKLKKAEEEKEKLVNENKKLKDTVEECKEAANENKKLKQDVEHSNKLANKYHLQLQLKQYSHSSSDALYKQKLEEKDRIIDEQKLLISDLSDKHREARSQILSQSVIKSREIANKKNEARDNEEKINRLNAVIDKLKQENAVLAKKATMLTTMQGEYTVLEERNRELQREKESLKNSACHEISVLQATCDVTKAKLNDSEKSMKKQISDLEMRLFDVNDLQTKTVEKMNSERKSSISKHEYEKSKKEISKLKDEIKDREITIGELKESITEQNKTIVTLSNELNNTKSILTQAQQEPILSRSCSSNISINSDSSTPNPYAEETRKKLQSALKTMDVEVDSEATVPQLTDSLIQALQSPTKDSQNKKKRVKKAKKQ